jgi:signal transduction histidine kinase/ActR/RegA family two-component response regulator
MASRQQHPKARRSARPRAASTRRHGLIDDLRRANEQLVRANLRNQELVEQAEFARAQAEAAHRRAAFLAEATELLAASLDYEATLATIARLAIPRFADGCFVDLVEKDAPLRRIVAAHREDASMDVAAQTGAFAALHAATHDAVTKALSDGTPVLVAELSGTKAHDLISTAENSMGGRHFTARAALAAPLVARDRPLGVVTFVLTEDSDRVYGENDVQLAAELARRFALAVDNAQLYWRAEESNRLKDEFLATLSHELRSPLNAIVGWAHILRDSAPDSPTARRAVQTILRNAHAQNQLVSDLLDISRIVVGKLSLNVAMVDLTTVTEAALDTVRPSADARGVNLSAKLEPLTAAFWGDAVRLQQVLWNLISNAVKFSPSGGNVQVTLQARGPAMQVTVEDEGPGIHPDFLPFLFERFRQQDSSTSRRHGGLGLGLAIVRHLVELHGGTVEASNRVGRPGAIFTVRLPRQGIPPERRPAAVLRQRSDEALATASVPRLDGLKVLVVDDDADAREAVATALERCGASTVTAASAAAALAILVRGTPDVLLADIAMPEADGYELLRSVRRLRADEGGLVPAAALTAYASREDRLRVLDAGFEAHISKPVDPAELAAVVSRLAHSRGR